MYNVQASCYYFSSWNIIQNCRKFTDANKMIWWFKKSLISEKSDQCVKEYLGSSESFGVLFPSLTEGTIHPSLSGPCPRAAFGIWWWQRQNERVTHTLLSPLGGLPMRKMHINTQPNSSDVKGSSVIFHLYIQSRLTEQSCKLCSISATHAAGKASPVASEQHLSSIIQSRPAQRRHHDRVTWRLGKEYTQEVRT